MNHAAVTRINHWSLLRAARCIQSGGVVAYPTESVFGLGCDPFNESAVMRLLEIKQRHWQQGLIVIAASLKQLAPLVDCSNDSLLRPARDSWPGPVTWLLPKRATTPRWLCGRHDSVAVRITAHPVAATLCRLSGSALVSTSANLSGRHPARTAWQVRRQFGRGIDAIVAGKTLVADGKPSEIRDARTGRIIRNG